MRNGQFINRPYMLIKCLGSNQEDVVTDYSG